MKNIIKSFVVCLAWLAITGAAYAGSSLPPAPPVQYVYPVVNSTAAAATNVTLIQNALNNGGNVNLVCTNGSVIYTNATLIIPSNTHLDLPKGATIRASTTGVGPLIENYAYGQSWTTLYDSTGSITTGPLAIIWGGSVPAWVGTTSYSKGNYVNNNNNIYWCATAGTSASSGGPTTTGAGITDGTVSWNYVTTWTPSIAGSDLFATINWPSHGLSVGNTVWVTPEPDTGSNNWWGGAQSAGTRGGPCDSAYFGIFQVSAVNDTNNITVILRRLPAAAFTGIPVNVKKADQNIQITGGGTWDFNTSTNTGNTGNNVHTAILGGVNHLRIDGFEGTNTNKYILDCCGIANADISNVNGSLLGGVTSDRVKIYGPCFDTVIHDCYGPGGDDVVSIQPQEASAYASYITACGDCLNITIRNVTSDSGANIALYASSSNVTMDNIEIAHCNLHANPQSGAGEISIAGSETSTQSKIGNVNIHDCTIRDGNFAFIGLINGASTGGVLFNTLNIYNCIVNTNSTTPGVNYLFNINSVNSEVQNLNIYGSTINLYGYGVYSYAGKIDLCNITGCNVYSPSVSSTNALVRTTSGSSGYVYSANISNNFFLSNIKYVVSDQTGMYVSFTNNYMPSATYGIVDSTHADNVYVANNYASGLTYGVERFDTNTFTSVITSGGGNNFGSTWYTNGSGTGTVTPYGFDIHIDVTKCSRTTGAYCYNTNTSPGSGTLTTAGPVIDQGTSSNSWCLVTNPTGQQY